MVNKFIMDTLKNIFHIFFNFQVNVRDTLVSINFDSIIMYVFYSRRLVD